MSGVRCQVSGSRNESRARGIADAAGAAQCCASIFEVGWVVRMNQICRILPLTSCIPADYRNSPKKKMLKRGVRSRNVYENKGNKDKGPNEKSDIYVDMTRLLHKKAAYECKSCGIGSRDLITW